MADSYGNVSVDTSADVIVDDLTQRRSVIIYNNGTAIVYIGFDDQVTSSNGMPILPQASIEIAGKLVTRKTAIYGISASGTQDIRYMYWDA